jgi:cysteine-rich repeat protein
VPIKTLDGYGGNASFLFMLFDPVSASITKSTATVIIQNVHPPTPAAPTQVIGVIQMDKLMVEWPAVVWANAPDIQSQSIAQYDVQASSSAGTYNWVTLASTTSATSFTHSQLPAYAGYVYRVRAISSNTYASAWSAPSALLRTPSVCGNEIREGNEECDVKEGGVGCATCKILPGYSCSGVKPDTCAPGCGDGTSPHSIHVCMCVCIYIYLYICMCVYIYISLYCFCITSDGNFAILVSCCISISNLTLSCVLTRAGAKANSEACDDGNMLAMDGCSQVCALT